MAKRMLFEHPTKRGVIVDENGREVSVEELSMGESGSNHTMCEAITEFNDLATGTSVKVAADKKLVEAWEAFGLSPEAARIAANVQESEFKAPETNAEWIKASEKMF